MSVLKFNCGCVIPVINGTPQIDYYNLNLECSKTWVTYQTGYTQSIFQLESYLGKMWSKKLKPASIPDAAALISIIRPGTLEAQNEAGESLTKVYCDRSNEKWKACQTNILEKLLEETYGINIYQESSMVLAAQVAGFDGAAQMKLIKSIGKKNAELLFSLRKEFISGCKKIGKVNEAEMNAIFDNIEASARYAFNKSHAVSYAVTGYWTAWVKSHLPKHYICSWLRSAKNEQKPLEEIRAVISEARRLGIRVLPPSIKNLPHTNFFIKKDAVHFGLDSIKGCGEKGLAKLLNLNIDFDSISWLDFLVQYSDKITKTQVVNMIRSGCFDCYFISRTEAEFQYNLWISVCNTPAAKAAAASLYDQHKPKTVRELFVLYHDACNLKKKKDSISDVIRNLDNPSYSLEDSKSLIIEHEKALLGINVTCSAVSKSSIPTVKDYCNSIDKLKNNTPVVIVGEISEYRDIKIKNGTMTGQIMGSFQLTDESGHCDCVIFPKELSLYEGALYDGNVILAHGKKRKQRRNYNRKNI